MHRVDATFEERFEYKLNYFYSFYCRLRIIDITVNNSLESLSNEKRNKTNLHPNEQIKPLAFVFKFYRRNQQTSSHVYYREERKYRNADQIDVIAFHFSYKTKC